MKQFLSVILAVVLVLGAAAAFAETAEKEYLGTIDMNGAFELKCRTPEGYSISEVNTEIDTGTFVAVIQSEDAGKPRMILSIAFDELLSKVERLNDLDAEALAKIEETFRMEDQVEITYMETAYGTKLMVTKEVRDQVDFVDFYTIYKGYQVEFVLIGGDEGKEALTEEQIQSAVDFLSELDFVEKSSEE